MILQIRLKAASRYGMASQRSWFLKRLEKVGGEVIEGERFLGKLRVTVRIPDDEESLNSLVSFRGVESYRVHENGLRDHE